MALKQRLFRTLAYPLLWPVIGMPGRNYTGPFHPLTETEQEIKTQLISSVDRLAVGIGERNARNYAGLLAAEEFISDTFAQYGYKVRSESFAFDGVQMRNIEAEIVGEGRPDEIVIFGAHYDTVYGSPGADDNASGVAALLELARLLAASSHGSPVRTVRFVAFANEENPGGAPWETMGSYHYARACKQRGEKIVGMVALEMLGVYSEADGSQRYPMPFPLFYPETGNFIAFIGNLGSRSWLRRCIKSFRNQCLFPSEGVTAPAFFRDINRSDHWSFWQFGYPGLMVTDTSNFRNKLYHTPKDTPEIIDFDRMTRVTSGLRDMLVDIVND